MTALDHLLPADQGWTDTHSASVGGDLLDTGHDRLDTHMFGAGVDPSPTSHRTIVPHGIAAGGHTLTAPARAAAAPNHAPLALSALPADQHAVDPHSDHVGGDSSDTDPADQGSHATQGSAVDWVGVNAELIIYAKTLEEMMSARIALGNRIFQLGDLGLEGSPEHARCVALHDAIKGLEHDAELTLKRAVRRHPLGPWAKAQVGVGEKTIGRLLAIIGNPADRPNPSKLWAYCGYHVVDGRAPKRRKGEQANWNTDAKTLVYLIAEACLKATGEPNKNGQPRPRSPFRDVYDAGRAKYADAVHTGDCPQCGICDGCGKPPGKNKETHAADTGCTDRRIRPAQAGDPLKDGHKHSRAMRLTSKAILLELWREARRIDGGAA